jgi:hypothetical protein
VRLRRKWSVLSPTFNRFKPVLADYPNDLVLKNIETNIKRNGDLLGSGWHEVRGHLWGSDLAPVLRCLDKSAHENDGELENDTSAVKPIGERFDVAVVAECLWLHHLVRRLNHGSGHRSNYWMEILTFDLLAGCIVLG